MYLLVCILHHDEMNEVLQSSTLICFLFNGTCLSPGMVGVCTFPLQWLDFGKLIWSHWSLWSPSWFTASPMSSGDLCFWCVEGLWIQNTCFLELGNLLGYPVVAWGGGFQNTYWSRSSSRSALSVRACGLWNTCLIWIQPYIMFGFDGRSLVMMAMVLPRRMPRWVQKNCYCDLKC